MDTLPEAFGMLTLLGLWKSNKWCIWKCTLYYCYTLLITYNVMFFIFTGITGLIVFSSNFIDMINDSSIIFTAITVIGKMITVKVQREKILQLIRSLEGIVFQPKNAEEHQLKERYLKSIRFYTYVYIAFIESSVITVNMLIMLECYGKGLLPYKAWFPYDTFDRYLFTSFQQVITIIFVANINVTYDTLLLGIIVHICLQVNILKHRFQEMLNELQGILLLKSDVNSEEYRTLEKTLVTKYVTYQNDIFKLVETLTDIFSQTMFLQFGLSTLILCTSIYALSQTAVFSPEFISCAVYISCMFLQIFLPCLIGNQMTSEFADLNNAMYNTNWYTLSNNFRKCMNIIMIKSSKPIVFSSGYILSLTLEAFTSLLKLSYSIFNVFQQSS